MSEVYSNSQSSGIDTHYIRAIGDVGNCWYKLPGTVNGKFNIKPISVKDRRGRNIGVTAEITIEEEVLTTTSLMIERLLTSTSPINHLLVLNNGKIFCTSSISSVTKPYPTYFGWEGSLDCKGDMSGYRVLTIKASVSGVSFDAIIGAYLSSMPNLGTRANPDLNYLAFLDSIVEDAIPSGGIANILYKLTGTPTTFGIGSASTSIVLNAASSAVDDYYNGWTIFWNGEWRTVTNYAGTAHTATINAAFVQGTPTSTDKYTIGQFVSLLNFGTAELKVGALPAKETDRWKRSICKNINFTLTLKRLQSTVEAEITELITQLGVPNDWQLILADGIYITLCDTIGAIGDIVNEGNADGLESINYTAEGIVTTTTWGLAVAPVIQ